MLRSMWTQFFCTYRQWDCHIPAMTSCVMITRGLKQWKRGKGRWTWASTSTGLYLSTQCLQNSNHSMHIAMLSSTKRASAIRYWCSFIWNCEVSTQQLSITYFFKKSYFYTGIPVTLYLFLASVGQSGEYNSLSSSWFLTHGMPFTHVHQSFSRHCPLGKDGQRFHCKK